LAADGRCDGGMAAGGRGGAMATVGERRRMAWAHLGDCLFIDLVQVLVLRQGTFDSSVSLSEHLGKKGPIEQQQATRQ